MTLDPRTLTSELRAETTHRVGEPEDPYDRAREAERAVYDGLRRARARVWQRCHWWGRDGVDPAPQG